MEVLKLFCKQCSDGFGDLKIVGGKDIWLLERDKNF